MRYTNFFSDFILWCFYIDSFYACDLCHNWLYQMRLDVHYAQRTSFHLIKRNKTFILFFFQYFHIFFLCDTINSKFLELHDDLCSSLRLVLRNNRYVLIDQHSFSYPYSSSIIFLIWVMICFFSLFLLPLIVPFFLLVHTFTRKMTNHLVRAPESLRPFNSTQAQHMLYSFLFVWIYSCKYNYI